MAPIESSYTGPNLNADGLPTSEFVDALIEWFKDGQVIPRRIAWQIVLGAYEVLKAEDSLVDALIPEGETINV
jgi:serine/threonine-protein phosphatase 5